MCGVEKYARNATLPIMRTIVFLLPGLLFLISNAPAGNPALDRIFDRESIRDVSKLETEVLEDWKPLKGHPDVRQKLIEITVCEWWPGQRVRLPVTFSVPAGGEICRNVVIANQGLSKRKARLNSGQLDLLENYGVGIVTIGMGTIDAMEPVGKLHDGMRVRLLKTRDLRYTPSWIWGMSDMRALTAAVSESAVFRPEKVLATGASKRGVATAVAGIVDDRFTAILPVIAPILHYPGGVYVMGTEKQSVVKTNEKFLDELSSGKSDLGPMTKKFLMERKGRRQAVRVTLEQARAAGWSSSEIEAANDRVWDTCRVLDFLPELKKRGLEIFYIVGTNDSVSPALMELGRKYPDFPVCIIPGGQHGSPRGIGYNRQVPAQAETAADFSTFAKHHFFGARSIPDPPGIETKWDAATLTLTATVRFHRKSTAPQKNELWWTGDRSEPYTYPFEFDHWNKIPMKMVGAGTCQAQLKLSKQQIPHRSLDVISLHTDVENNLPFTFSSPYHRMAFSGGKPSPLLDEDFEGPSLPDHWQPGGRKGSWTIVDGTLRGVARPDDSHGPSIGVPISAHDLSVDFDFRYAKKGKGYFLFLIDGDSQFQGQAHLLRFSAHHQVAMIMQDRGDPVSKKAQKAARDKNGGKRIPPTREQLADDRFYRIEPLGKREADPADGKWHHVRIDVKGNQVTAKLDEGPAIVGEGTVLDVPKSRLVFLVGQSGDLRIDHVKVKTR